MDRLADVNSHREAPPTFSGDVIKDQRVSLLVFTLKVSYFWGIWRFANAGVELLLPLEKSLFFRDFRNLCDSASRSRSSIQTNVVGNQNEANFPKISLLALCHRRAWNS